MKKYFAPGRVNLIGEHIDYNGGKVLPMAISLGITAYVSQNFNGLIELSSATHTQKLSTPLNAPISYAPEQDWLNYPLGILKALKDRNHNLPPLNIHFESTLPEGSSLSSSAALEVLTMYLLLQEGGNEVPKPEIAVWCKEVENNFVGVQCGIMDQFVVANARKNHALLLDCNTLEHEHIPLSLGNYKLVVMNSCKPRQLIHSKYNERKAECDKALELININSSIPLVNLSGADELCIDTIGDEVLSRRAKHVVSENARVYAVVNALKNNDIPYIGKLLNQSHASLKHDYEVSGVELDTLVETAQSTIGCIGARMTGAGFGGCAIALVKETHLVEFEDNVLRTYQKVTGLSGEIYVCDAADGVSLQA